MGWRVTFHCLRSRRCVRHPASEHCSDRSRLGLAGTAQVPHVCVSVKGWALRLHVELKNARLIHVHQAQDYPDPAHPGLLIL